ncbi:MAG: sulfatase-like hydrolase/transferase, partial [Anaerolineales bacterium]|nr:sulfatase-like hydrolase/transferase [Anaerolineales bacterium]
DPVYAAMIEHLDENIGRLINAVQNNGLAENTLIVFTSDNGGLSTSEGSPTCNFPLSEGKGWMYEGGTREPLIIKWPKVVQPGTVCHIPVTSPDFYTTLLEAAQSDLMPEQHQDGCSILPLLQDKEAIDRDAIYWHYPHYGNQGGTPGCSIRSGQYKLIEFFEDRRLELYDLETDIGEEHNLSEIYPELTKALHTKLVLWRNQVHALIPQPNPDWNELD